MAGLDPAIHALPVDAVSGSVDARLKAGHDDKDDNEPSECVRALGASRCRLSQPVYARRGRCTGERCAPCRRLPASTRGSGEQGTPYPCGGSSRELQGASSCSHLAAKGLASTLLDEQINGDDLSH